MTNGTNVRLAVHQDADTVVEFNTRMAMETEKKRLDPGVLTAGVMAVLNNPQLGFYLVAERDGRVVGSLLITTEWSDWRNGFFWWIQSVYVAPECRRHGIFSALYRDAEARARKASNVCGFRLYVERENEGAQATYTRMGMTETKYRFFEKSFA